MRFLSVELWLCVLESHILNLCILARICASKGRPLASLSYLLITVESPPFWPAYVLNFIRNHSTTTATDDFPRASICYYPIISFADWTYKCSGLLLLLMCYYCQFFSNIVVSIGKIRTCNILLHAIALRCGHIDENCILSGHCIAFKYT